MEKYNLLIHFTDKADLVLLDIDIKEAVAMIESNSKDMEISSIARVVEKVVKNEKVD